MAGVHGFVVGNRRNEAWSLKVAHPGHPLDGMKLKVSPRCDTSKLIPGLWVSMQIGMTGPENDRAYVVVGVEPELVEAPNVSAPPGSTQSGDESINIAVVESLDGEVEVGFVGFGSEEETREFYERETSGDQQLLLLEKIMVREIPAGCSEGVTVGTLSAFSAQVYGVEDYRDVTEYVMSRVVQATLRSKGLNVK